MTDSLKFFPVPAPLAYGDDAVRSAPLHRPVAHAIVPAVAADQAGAHSGIDQPGKGVNVRRDAVDEALLTQSSDEDFSPRDNAVSGRHGGELQGGCLLEATLIK